MKRYSVGYTYTVWVEVEAENETDAINESLEIPYDFRDIRNTDAKMELNEFDDPIVLEVEDAEYI